MGAEVHRLAAAVRTEFPDAVASIDSPVNPDGVWWLDLEMTGHRLHVECSPKRFGLHAIPSEGYGEGPNEILQEFDLAWARLRALLSAARDAPQDLVGYERMLAQLRAADVQTEASLYEALGHFLRDASYPQPDIRKAEHRLRREKGWS